ncbi:MAG: hypothetical protein V7L25_18865 [Nostoc sp.]|uniref:hypothetical protein n=1 Tax=Nostoc sp. TaxID=1180 RepID=UPI002FF26D46
MKKASRQHWRQVKNKCILSIRPNIEINLKENNNQKKRGGERQPMAASPLLSQLSLLLVVPVIFALSRILYLPLIVAAVLTLL